MHKFNRIALGVFGVIAGVVALTSSVNALAANKIQRCEVAFNGNLHRVECEPSLMYANYVTTRGDTKYIQCQNAAFPLATGCKYVNIMQ